MENQITTEQNSLVQIIEQSGLEKTKAQVLLEKFSDYFNIASEWETKAKALIITDATQITEMQQAREGRLFLVKKRTSIETVRKTLKEDSLREGQTIDAIAKILKNLIEPIEKDLEEKEKFAERKEAERKELLKNERLEKLIKYISDPSIYPLAQMTELDFNNLYEGSKLAHEARKAAELKAEQDRIEKEILEAEARENQRLENERLKLENEVKEKQLEAERIEANRIASEAKAKADAELAEANRLAKIESDKQAKILEEQRVANEKLQAELKAKADAELKEKQRIEAEQKAKELAEKKAAKAPDKDKLTIMISGLSLPVVELKQNDSIALQDVINQKFTGFKNWATEQINNL